jgi:hypothetical protein
VDATPVINKFFQTISKLFKIMDFKALLKQRQTSLTSGRAFVQIMSQEEFLAYKAANPSTPSPIVDVPARAKLEMITVLSCETTRTMKRKKDNKELLSLSVRAVNERTGQVVHYFPVVEADAKLPEPGTVVKANFVSLNKGETFLQGKTGTWSEDEGCHTEAEVIVALRDNTLQYAGFGAAFEVSGKELIATAIANSSFSQTAKAGKEKD